MTVVCVNVRKITTLDLDLVCCLLRSLLHVLMDMALVLSIQCGKCADQQNGHSHQQHYLHTPSTGVFIILSLLHSLYVSTVNTLSLCSKQ